MEQRNSGRTWWNFSLIQVLGVTKPPGMLLIRQLAPADSLEELTHLLHRAYAQLGGMGLNYTAVSQPTETTARRLMRNKTD